MAEKGKISPQKDNNRQRKIEATRKLQQLMLMAESRDFTGHIEVQVYAKGGLLGRFEAGMREYCPCPVNSP